MRVIISIISCFFCFIFINLVLSDSKLDEATLNPEASYCFEFTWFGPDYDNNTRYNGTCEDYLTEHGAVGIPCNPPIVITYNGTFPDIEYLWKYHKSSIICRRSSGQVCARYAYYDLNGAMKNSTYMCTKVQVVGEDAIRNGCYKQTVHDYVVEVCACESGKGIYKPCNINF